MVEKVEKVGRLMKVEQIEKVEQTAMSLKSDHGSRTRECILLDSLARRNQCPS